MQNSALLNPKITVNAQSPDVLVVSRTFLPKEGGIEEYVYNRCLQDPDKLILLSAHHPGDKDFDREQPFLAYRWFLPQIPGKLGSFIKQLFNLIGSLVLSIALYFRYRYRYIEWGHGYDFLSLLLITYLLPVKCFVYLHGNDLLCPQKNTVFRWAFSLTLSRLEGIVCNSTFTADYLKQHFQITTPIHVINPTVRPQKFCIQSLEHLKPESSDSIRKTYNISETAIVILSVGRLVARKGCDRLIQSLPPLIAKGIEVHYIICGRGPLESDLRSLSHRLGLEERVHFAGYVPDVTLAKYYLACDIFALTTFFDVQDASIEGFGIVYREAGFFGKPVVASKIGGVIDAVQDQENGILVDPDSAEELVHALNLLCHDPQLRARLGAKGRELATLQTPHRSLYITPLVS